MDTKHEAPHQPFETFKLPIDDIEVDAQRMMRETNEADLRELAESMRSSIGQILPVFVEWVGDHYRLVAGLRRLMAMRTFKKEMGFQNIIAWRVLRKDADLIRLAENAARKNPSCFETAHYVYRLATHSRGRKKLHSREIGAIIGKSGPHVRKLLSLYRGAPPALKKAWEADRSGAFTFERLQELVRQGQHLNEAQLLDLIAKMLGQGPIEAMPVPAMPGLPTLAVEAPRSATTSRGPRGLGRRRVKMLIARLEEDATLVQEDEVAKVVHTLLRGMAGLESVETCVELVEQLRAGRSIAAPTRLVATPPLQITPSPSRPQIAAT